MTSEQYTGLSTREKEVMRLCLQGKSIQKSAAAMRVSDEYVRRLLKGACKKMRTNDKHDAARKARRVGEI